MTAERKAVPENQNKKRKFEFTEYRVVGEKFKNKQEAYAELKKVFKKGFHKAGFIIQGNEFAILFGTYATEKIAKANVVAVQKAGFKAEVI